MTDENEWQMELNYAIEGITDRVFDWLVRINYWYGWNRGVAYEKERGETQASPYLIGYEPHPSRLQFYWSIYYGHLHLEIKDCETDSLSSIYLEGRRIDSLVVITSRDWNKINKEVIEKLAPSLEDLIKKFFPGISQMNGLRICTSPAHHRPAGNQPELLFKPHPLICKQIGKRWLCENCIERFNLGGGKPTDTGIVLKKHQRELQKLTPARWLEVLERDNFTCQNCHRSPGFENDIKLRVVYHVPVMEGGKTVLENLTTLCHACPIP